MTKNKKSFTYENPALAYISTVEKKALKDCIDLERTQEEHLQSPKKNQEHTPQECKQKLCPPPGYKIDHRFVETKSRRVNLLLQPSLVDEAKLLAEVQKVSLNELVSIALRYYLLSTKEK